MWQAGVGVSLPLYRKRLAGGVAEAEAQLRAGQQQVDSIRLQLRFRTRERLAQLEATEGMERLYGQGIVPQDEMSVEAAVANYQAGKVPFIAVLEALTTLYNDRVAHLRLIANHERIRASLEEASVEAMVAGGAGSMPGGSRGSAEAGSMGNR
jgi:outer membrane protein TolC